MKHNIEKKIKDNINEIIEKEVENRVKELKANINKVEVGDLFNHKYIGTSDYISSSMWVNILKEPTFSYTYNDEDGFFNSGTITISIYMNKNLKSGIAVRTKEHDDELDICDFKTCKRGKHGRDVMCDTYINKKLFFEHYDDFIVDRILLGVDD